MNCFSNCHPVYPQTAGSGPAATAALRAASHLTQKITVVMLQTSVILTVTCQKWFPSLYTFRKYMMPYF